MRNKWIILDEMSVELLETESGGVRMFEFKEMAIDWAERHCHKYQIIEIHFGEDCMRK